LKDCRAERFPLFTSCDTRQSAVVCLGRQRREARRVDWKNLVMPDKMSQELSIVLLSPNHLAHLLSGEREQPLDDDPGRMNPRT
jgi:hypothetical protein